MDTNDEALSKLARGMDRRQAELAQRLNGGRRSWGTRSRPQDPPQHPDDDWLTEIASVSSDEGGPVVPEAPPMPAPGLDSRSLVMAQRASGAAERLSQLAASLGSEPPDAVDPATRQWLALAAEQLDQILASRPRPGNG